VSFDFNFLTAEFHSSSLIDVGSILEKENIDAIEHGAKVLALITIVKEAIRCNDCVLVFSRSIPTLGKLIAYYFHLCHRISFLSSFRFLGTDVDQNESIDVTDSTRWFDTNKCQSFNN
jgi:hypothetical protein